MSGKRYKKKPVVDRRFGIDGVSIILWSKKIHFIHIVCFLVAFYFIWHTIGISIDNRAIEKKGKVINGVIVDTRKVGGKGIRRCTYYFSTDKGKYEGSIDDDYINIGDSIEIFYLPNDPSKNRAAKFFER